MQTHNCDHEMIRLLLGDWQLFSVKVWAGFGSTQARVPFSLKFLPMQLAIVLHIAILVAKDMPLPVDVSKRLPNTRLPLFDSPIPRVEISNCSKNRTRADAWA